MCVCGVGVGGVVYCMCAEGTDKGPQENCSYENKNKQSTCPTYDKIIYQHFRESHIYDPCSPNTFELQKSLTFIGDGCCDTVKCGRRKAPQTQQRLSTNRIWIIMKTTEILSGQCVCHQSMIQSGALGNAQLVKVRCVYRDVHENPLVPVSIKFGGQNH